MFKRALISVCIPVFKTEALLKSCIDSVLAQDFFGIEIIVVDDGSVPDKGMPKVYDIVQKVKYSSKIPIKLIEHSKNLGLVEARRSAVYSAKGQYIFNLDSDDTLPHDALKKLYSVAQSTGADIVQGRSNFVGDVLPQVVEKRQKQIEEKFIGFLDTKDNQNLILDKYLLEQKISGYLWGKLIKRDVYIQAFSRIPPVFCNFADDVIQSIWIYKYAKSFVGITDRVYNYSLSGGITSKRQIDSLEKWEQVCTTASVFTAIISECENENPFTASQMDSIKLLCQKYVANNLIQLKSVVVPELQVQAKELLCEYWGQDLVEYIEEKMK